MKWSSLKAKKFGRIKSRTSHDHGLKLIFFKEYNEESRRRSSLFFNADFIKYIFLQWRKREKKTEMNKRFPFFPPLKVLRPR
jgi:hypothetical protein